MAHVKELSTDNVLENVKNAFIVTLVCNGLLNNVTKAEWLKQQKLIVSQFWSLEVQD